MHYTVPPPPALRMTVETPAYIYTVGSRQATSFLLCTTQWAPPALRLAVETVETLS